MALPQVVSREEWLAARKELLVREKELTKARDALAAERRRLPMVRIDKEYALEGPQGKASLLDLFEGRRQLIVYHFMWLQDKDMGCPNCSAFTDHISRGLLTHLRLNDTALALVSRGQIDRIEAFKARMGWKVPWYSSFGTDFNHDFGVTLDESVAQFEYNYRTKEEWARTTFLINEWAQPFDLHGLSCLVRDGQDVYHTYSTYGRGTEVVGGTGYFLDLTALGRQEPWEEPKDRLDAPEPEFSGLLYPDEYEQP